MERTASATELAPVLVEASGAGADVWLRRNIGQTTDGDGNAVWVADEIHGTVGWVPTAREVEEDFDHWWETFERAAKTDRELIEEARDMAERAQAQADFTALMTDTEV